MANPFAGLFGPAGGGWGGLLDPRSQAMLGAAQALTQAGGPTRVPVSTGAALSGAMANASANYRQAQAAGMQQQIQKMQYDAAQRSQVAAQAKKLARDRYISALQAGGKNMAGNPVNMNALAAAAAPDAFIGAEIKSRFKTPKRPAPGMVWDTVTNTWKMDPAYTAHKLEIATAQKPTTTTTVNMQQEKEEKKAFGKSLVATYDAIAARADTAETARQQIAMGRGFVREDTVLPSALAQAAGNAAVAMGFDVKNLKGVLGNISSGQGFTATMQNLVLSKMQAQKGPQTESDTRLIQKTVAGLGNTPEARDFLLRASDALAQADVMKADFWRRWRAGKGGGSFDGAASAWRKFRNKVPFMGISPATKKHMFFAEFADANRHKTFDEIVGEWSRNYAGTAGSR